MATQEDWDQEHISVLTGASTKPPCSAPGVTQTSLKGPQGTDSISRDSSLKEWVRFCAKE